MLNHWNTLYMRKALYSESRTQSILARIESGVIRNTTRGTDAAKYAHLTNNANPYCNPMSCFTHEPAVDIEDCYAKIRNYLDTSSSAHGINVSMFDLKVDWRSEVVRFLLSYKNKDRLHIADSIIRFTVDIWHQDIIHFLKSLTPFEDNTEIFSWCVGIRDDFLEAVKTRQKYPLCRPSLKLINDYESRSEEDIVEWVDAYEIYLKLMMAQSEHKFSIINLTQMNKLNMNPNLGPITCTNICTEITGLGSFVCCLGSINLFKLVVDGAFDFDEFESCVESLVYHLNYLIEITHVKETNNYTHFAKRVLRPIGIGFAGLAESHEIHQLVEKQISFF